MILDSLYDSHIMQPENARSNNVEVEVVEDKLSSNEFKKLWSKINTRSVYVVDFDTQELVEKCIATLDKDLCVSKIYFKVETGTMHDIKSKEELLNGTTFVKEKSASYGANTKVAVHQGVKYDLVGKIVAETGLTRLTVVNILKGIKKETFNQFKDNPEEFIIKAAGLIEEQKATVIIQHIAYNKLEEVYDTSIFTEPTLKGKLGVNAIATPNKSLFDHVIYDSTNERDFAEQLDVSDEVAIYVKLPKGFYISTPVGKYNPDWAIAFHEGPIKHIYFIAETKGSMASMQLRDIEKAKIHCAREHFKVISSDKVKYDVIDNYSSLMNKVMS